jgi:hypothetical protein
MNMKFYLKPVLSVVALAILLGYSGCGGGKEPGPSDEEKALTALSATWKVSGTNTDVTLNGVSRKADYANFTLTVSGTAGAATYGYTTAGRPVLSAWPSSGSWKFGDVIATDIIRDPGDTNKELDMHYTVSDTQLELTFIYDKAGESRTSQVTGTWVFRLSK